MPDEGGDVGAEWQALQRRHVSVAVGPRLVVVHCGDDLVPRDRLDPAEQVPGVDAADVHGRQRAGTEHRGGHAVAQRLRQRRPVEYLDVVVRVDVQHAG